MSGLKDLAKGGWHPKGKSGGKESWRGDNKGINQVAGWLGKGKDTIAEAHEHQSAPISSLKDPESFGPPPRRHPDTLGGVGSPTASSSTDAGLGSALTPDEIRRQEIARQQAAEEVQKPAPPPVPYRADTTGLSTASLPKPPVRRADGGGLQPAVAVTASPKPKPKLPPRLPPRAVGTPLVPDSPPPSYNDTTRLGSTARLNPGALDRLGRAGISVPGFGIGKPTTPPLPSRTESTSPSQPPMSPPVNANQLGELQSRFSKMRTGSTESTSANASASQGTSWEQKRAALKTASDFQKNPSSVKLSDMRSAASTANNFRERHGEQVAAGWKTASGLNEKYGIADKARSYSGEEAERPDASTELAPPPSPVTLVKRGPPPPPPAKKKELHSGPVEPPPVPIGSKPRPT